MRTIKVIQEHIDRARKILSKDRSNWECNCPIALAMKDMGFLVHGVGYMRVECSGFIAEDALLLPKIARDCVLNFDFGYPVEPFEFQLPID